MMQKIIVLLLALLLPLYAGAENIAERINAPERVVDTFASNTGKTVITVDADVYVPHAERVPVYSVTPRFFTPEELKAMAEVCFGGIPYTYEWNDQAENIGQFSVFSIKAQDHSSCYLYGTMWKTNDGTIRDVSAEFENHRTESGTWYPTNRLSNVYLGDQPVGCSLTREEARRIVDAAVSMFAPGLACVGQAVIRGESTAETETYTETYSGQEAWVLYFGKALELPVTYEISFPNDPYNYVHHPETLVMVVDDLGIAGAAFNAPYTLDGMLEENCTLLPFDQIISVASTLMPLKIASYEQSYADIRVQITDIRLGYMYVSRINAPGEYALTPVWDFIGTVQYRQQKNGALTAENSTPFQSFLTINAINGTVIDRMYGY